MVHASDLDPGLSVEAWLARLVETPGIGTHLRASFEQQLERGYGHTLREICQQPVTWLETASRVAVSRGPIDATLDAAGASGGGGALVLTGSGSVENLDVLATPFSGQFRSCQLQPSSVAIVLPNAVVH